MSVYLARNVQANHTHVLFLQRGLNGLAPTQLSVLNLKGFPIIREIAHDAYSANIDMFVAATIRVEKLIVSAEGAHIKLSRTVLPIAHPPVCFVPAVPMNPDQLTALLKKIEKLRPEVSTQGNTKVITLQSMTPIAIDYIERIALENSHGGKGSIPFRTYKALLHLETCLLGFLATNTYPAFSKRDEDMDDTPAAAESGDRLLLQGGFRRRMPDSDVMIKRRKVMMGGDDIEAVKDTVTDEDPDAYEDELCLDGSVIVAKPSPIPPTFNFGDVSKCPSNLPGLTFPWFPRMNLPDKVSLRTLFTTLFLRTLGNDHESIKAEYKKWRADIEPICETDLGMAYSHLMTGMKLSLETQTRLYCIIQRNQYVGFVLLGAKFSLFNGTTWIQPVSPEELRVQLRQMSAHDVALEKIAEGISVMTIAVPAAAGVVQEVTSADIDTAVKLFKRLAIRDRSTAPDGMTEHFGQLSYDVPYRTIGSKDIEIALNEMVDNVPLLDDVPLYIPPSMPAEFFEDRIYQILASFGPESFSLLNTTGTQYALQNPDLPEDLSTITQGGTRTKPGILVSRKGVAVAYRDMRQVIREKMYRMNMSERAARFRNLYYDGEPRDRIMFLLRKLAWNDAAPEVRAVKRRGGPAGAREDAGKKAKTAADVLALDVNF
jgi:hypothetical protein